MMEYVNPLSGSLLSKDSENQPITSLKFYTNCHDVIITQGQDFDIF